MKVELAIAGLCCFVMAFGHTAIGLRWILPALKGVELPGTPFGSPRVSVAMLRFTWQVVSILLVALGILLTTLAWAPGADAETLLLRWLAAFWLAAAALAIWSVRRRPRTILRLPVPVLMLVVAAMCWTAST
jgi:hypothetical protein